MSWEKLIGELFSVKGVVTLLSTLFIILILIWVLSEFQKSPIGQNPEANQTLETTKQTLGIVPSFLIFLDDAKGAIALIVILGSLIIYGIYRYKKYNDEY